MEFFYRNVLLPPIRYVTRNDAEIAHEWLVSILIWLQRHPKLLRAVLPRETFRSPILSQTLMDGLEFENPFGTAAGFDKNALIYPALERLTGAGFIELGGVTLNRQPGNPRPRLVRVGKNNLINEMGFNNDGVDAAVDNIYGLPHPAVPIALQIVKQKVTPNEESAVEYGRIIDHLAQLHEDRALPDFIVINVSSPNTPGLRAMQDPKPLAEVLDSATQAMDRTGRNRKRSLIKLAPELERADIETITGLVEQFDIGGIILTNTTTTRPIRSKHDERAGGFSGSDLYPISAPLVKFAASILSKDRVLVATGGIDTVDRAYEMLHFADLVGGYTGLVLQGPNLFRRLAAGVVKRMRDDGVASLSELRKGNRPQSSSGSNPKSSRVDQ